MSTTTTVLNRSSSPLYIFSRTAPNMVNLPVELLEMISFELDRPELAILSRTNKFFHDICTRHLYRHITQVTQAQAIRLLRSFIRSPNAERTRKRTETVRTLHLDLSNNRVTANFLRLLQRALQLLRSLEDLSLEFGIHDNHYSIAWCLKNCPFQLRMFTTSIRCDESLASFVEEQRELEELVLRGFQTTSPFILSPEALPKLVAFRTVHAGVPVLRQVMQGRQIEAVSLSLFQEEMCEPLDTLLLPQTRIKRLTIMSLGDTPPALLFPEVSARLPDLEALHIVVLMAKYSYEDLHDSAPYLKAFSCLRYLTFMTGCDTEIIEDEKRVVNSWFNACPSLRTIILPRGKVWFEREGRWTCHASE